MNNNLQIPGYYYDSAKRKYFRIETSRTAPAEAAWSAQNVKRRAVEDKKHAVREERMRREAGRIKRAPVLQAPLLGGLLARETGAGGGSTAAVEETLGRAWAGALKDKGEVKMWVWEGQAVVSSMWVGVGDDRRGLGVAYGVLNERLLAGSYLPRDEEECINFGHAAEKYPAISFQSRHNRPRVEPVISAVKFHEPSGRMLLAHHNHTGGPVSIQSFTPPGNSARGWLLDDYSSDIHFNKFSLAKDSANVIYAMEPAPTSSQPITCIAGTDRGIIQLLPSGQLTCLTPLALPRPRPPPPPRYPHRRPRRHPPSHNYQHDPDILPWQRDVLAVSFLPSSSSTILAGTRSGHVCALDLRTPPASWSAARNTFRHASSAAHVRAVGFRGGGQDVLVAGPRGKMGVYDLRFLKEGGGREGVVAGWVSESGSKGSKKGGGGGGEWKTWPVVTFPAYRNAAHLQTGLDVLPPAAGYGSGLVAAALDDGSVGVYSLGDGACVAAGAVDDIRAPMVVRSLLWSTLPGERHPGLFVGEGKGIRKYSFWT